MSVPISNVTRRVVFAPSGTGPYAFTFEILAATDIEVYKGDTLLTLTTDYTVTINTNGTGSVTLVLTAGTDNITIVGARAIQRTTDFNTGGDFFANTLNDELDSLTIFAQQNAEGLARALTAPETDPTTIDMTLPRKADRAGKYLAFDVDGNPAPGPTAVDINTVVGLVDEIAAVSAIDTEITTVAGIDSNVTTVAGIAGNVSTVAGISGNVTTVAGISANVTSVAGNATNINTVAGVSGNVTTVAGVAANVTTVAGIAADVTAVAGDATDIGTVAGIAADVSAVAAIDSDVSTVAADGADIGAVAAIDSDVTTVAGIAANVTTVAGISADVTSVAGNASNINQVASDTVAINAASTNATNAANSATAASGSASAAAASAAAANAVSLGNEPIAPSIRPSLNLDFANVKALDPRISFVRTTTATYYGTETAKAEENLLLQSEDFTTTWTNSNTTDSANTAVAPDGTTTADTITETATSGNHAIRQTNVSVTSGVRYVWSVFAKKGDGATAPDIIQVSWHDSGFSTTAFANYDISVGGGTSGTVTTTGAGAVSASIVDVGNGWYRCVLIADATATATSGMSVFFTNNNPTATRAPSYLGVVTADVYLWGAQLEQRSAVTAYTPTTTQPITNYIPVLETAAAGEARFDHNPTTFESLGLLVEEQRTNDLTYSEDFADASWTKTRSSIEANTIVAPDGTLTGDKLIDTTDNDTHIVSKSITTTAVARTFSVFAKQGGRSHITMTITDSGNTARTTYFNLATGAVGTTGTGITASIVNVGNGFYRCIVTIATAYAGTNPHTIGTATADNTNSYAGNGYDGVFIWGAQAE